MFCIILLYVKDIFKKKSINECSKVKVNQLQGFSIQNCISFLICKQNNK